MHVIMDTGPWVALIDRSGSYHGKCINWLEQYDGEIFTSEAVLTEVLYLLNFSSRAQFSALDFILTGAIVMVPSSIESLKESKSLMKKYQDLPMDFADSTLVCLAHDLDIENILTFDRKHFNVYRIGKMGAFNILPL